MNLDLPQQTKHAVNAGAAATGGLAFFKVVPWPEIAGFLSACWLTIQLATWARKRIRELIARYWRGSDT